MMEKGWTLSLFIDPSVPYFHTQGILKYPEFLLLTKFVDMLKNVFCNIIVSHFNSDLGEVQCSASHVVYFMPTDYCIKLLYKWEKTFLINIYVYLYGWETL